MGVGTGTHRMGGEIPVPLQSQRMKLILASASPRRQDLLRAAGIAFTAQATNIPEIPREGEEPRAFAERLAREKAAAVAQAHPRNAVLGADTIVVVDGVILGKPTDAADAGRMLRMLSGRTHEVITAVCLIAPGPRSGAGSEPDVRSETTQVTFSELRDDEIAFYIGSGEPMDKAGAYGIQGVASRWIPRIAGDYSNVVGLPVALVYRMLKEHGIL
jgi:septum formation protein